jgi:hypothetical protein
MLYVTAVVKGYDQSMQRRAVAVASSGVSKKRERGKEGVFTPIYSLVILVGSGVCSAASQRV